MKILNRAGRDSTPHYMDLHHEVAKSSSTRKLRAGIFSRFRRSSVESSSVSKKSAWKRCEEFEPVTTPSQIEQDFFFKGNPVYDNFAVRNNMMRASSYAATETSIPTDGSMGATTSTESSLCQDGDSSFLLQATETLIETREILIPTADGQIETQQQECILVDMKYLDSDSDFSQQLLHEEDSRSTALDDFKENIEITSLSQGSQIDECESCSSSSDEKFRKGIAEIEDDDDTSVSSDDQQNEGGDDEEEDSFSDCQEEVETLRDANKGIALLQSFFLQDGDDDEYSFDDDFSCEEGRNITDESTFTSTFDKLEDLAAESIYSASLFLLGTTEVERRK
ncbi:hypothetical protein IV203_013225 [Nitzschia inconspicua]|uniref:Uncharacterized protein n=1 Tax=Nitzschia inconspicua TaxID=303405 RepID=A0A9K3M6K5_9STRA|nr:hypothetical protein IV203_013225 [Nitzschia inconspicua]